jgi:hypothetical protein
MKRLYTLIALCLLLSVPAVASEWISLVPGKTDGAEPEVRLISSNVAQTQVEIVLPGFFMFETPEGMDLYVPGWSQTGNVGLPALPKTSFFMALPENLPVSFDVAVLGQARFEGYTITPLPEPTTDNQKPAGPVQPKAWKGIYPVEDAVQGHAGLMGDLPVTAVVAYPFHVDAGTGDLTVYSHMVVTVHHDYGHELWPEVSLTDNVLRRSRGEVINFSSVAQASSRAGGINYLFLVKAGLESAIQPLVDWREKTGFITEIHAFGLKPTQYLVKNKIMEYTDLEYVLIVGDDGDIPLANWSGDYGDHWYACTTGGSNPDLYADLGIGRLCGSDSARISTQVDKILDYEKSPPLNAWLKHTVLVANGEQYPGKYTQCKEEIRTKLATTSDWQVTKAYGGETGITNATVTWQINQGVNLLNYRGHGDIQLWASWNKLGESFYNSDVEALSNGDKRPIVFNIACNCSDIRSYCMSECWMDTPGGAVAALGAVHPSYTIPNHDFDKKLYEAIFEKDMTDIASAHMYASTYIVNNHGSIGADNARMYLWLGDPAMKVWLNIPSAVNVSHDASIPAGFQTFDVTVETTGGDPIEGATVCLMKPNEVHAMGTTGADGVASIDISPTTSSELYVTVCHPDHMPGESTAMVGEGDLHIDTSVFSARDGGTVNFGLDAGMANGNRAYILLGSISGTSPGTPLPGGQVNLPLNFDAFTDIVMLLLNTPVFVDFMGQLDASGTATAQLSSGQISNAFIGTTMYFAYALNAPWNYASAPVGVLIVE